MVGTTKDRSQSIDDYAQALGISAAHFSRLFRQAFGMSFFRWRQQRMIEQAKAELSRGVKIKIIARALGYSDGPAFSNAFYAATGQWPTQYVERHKRR
jgi:AraC-like DNA-binding protein